MTTESSTAKPKVKIWLALGIGGSGVLICGLILWNMLQGTAQGTVQTAVEKTAQTSAPNITYVQLKGQTFTLEYPSTYKQAVLGSKDSYSGLDAFLLVARATGTSDHIAVSVQRQNGGLSSNSSYRLRKQSPQQYAETLRSVAGATAHLMTKTQDGYEQTVFLAKGDLLATVSLTSSNADPGLHGTVMDRLLSSFHWSGP